MWRRIVHSSSGGVAISTAILLTLLIGLAGLGVEVAHWYELKRSMQGASDAAAISAALAFTGSCDAGTPCQLTGLAVAAQNGWQTTSTNGVTVLVKYPPGPESAFYNTPNAVEVLIQQPQTPLFGSIGGLSSPTVGAWSVVKWTAIVTTNGSTCVLALANAANAILVHGSQQAGIIAHCGLAVDGGLTQNTNSNSSVCASDGAPCGDIAFQGLNSFIKVTSLTVAASLSDAQADCSTQNGHCFDFTTGGTLAAIFHDPFTDPYSARTFTLPGSVVTAINTIANAGTGYSNGAHTFTVVGGSGAPAKFNATVSGGKVTAIGPIVDPGSYTNLPTTPVSATVDSGGGAGASFTITTGECYDALPSPPVPGRAYCAISISGNSSNTFFPAGIYYIEGGDATCVGFCTSGAKLVVCSQDFFSNGACGSTAVASSFNGVTFVLTKKPSSPAGAGPYARLNVTSGTLNLSAPLLGSPINADGTQCSSGCANLTDQLLFFQDKNAPATADPYTGGTCGDTTTNCMTGNGSETLSGSLYFRNQTVVFQGTPSMGGVCFGVVAKYVDVGGTPTFANGCLPGSSGGSTTKYANQTLAE